MQQSYDGDGLRVKKVEQGVATYYVRSSVLGGQVICEINGWGGWTRGYVYLGGQLVAIQDGQVIFVHQDPITKSQRLTDTAGNVVSGIELDPWGGETTRSWNQGRQPHQYTTYERDQNQSDDAQARRYNRWWSRFDQPDPFDGSYNLSDPQSFNRYSYVQNDPVNFTDPSGLLLAPPSVGTSINVSDYYDSSLSLFGGSVFYRDFGSSFDAPDPSTGTYDPNDPNDADPPQTRQQSDPCAGKKGKLNFFAGSKIGIPHITDRHIDRSQNPRASKYTFNTLQSSLIDKQTAVMNLDQQTFMNATGYNQQRGGNIAYVYAFPDFNYSVQGLTGPIGVRGFQEVGTDRDHNGDRTNVNTVIVDPDCSSVITSFPGLPGDISSPSDPRITGNPQWGTSPPGYTIKR